jgi:hypothetical protein
MPRTAVLNSESSWSLAGSRFVSGASWRSSLVSGFLVRPLAARSGYCSSRPKEHWRIVPRRSQDCRQNLRKLWRRRPFRFEPARQVAPASRLAKGPVTWLIRETTQQLPARVDDNLLGPGSQPPLVGPFADDLPASIMMRLRVIDRFLGSDLQSSGPAGRHDLERAAVYAKMRAVGVSLF